VQWEKLEGRGKNNKQKRQRKSYRFLTTLLNNN